MLIKQSSGLYIKQSYWSSDCDVLLSPSTTLACLQNTYVTNVLPHQAGQKRSCSSQGWELTLKKAGGEADPGKLDTSTQVPRSGWPPSLSVHYSNASRLTLRENLRGFQEASWSLCIAVYYRGASGYSLAAIFLDGEWVSQKICFKLKQKKS